MVIIRGKILIPTNKMHITIHANASIPWQKRLAPLVVRGLQKHGLKCYISPHNYCVPKTDVSIILGPNFWKNIENSGQPYIMMNRKFLGFHERDVHDNVAISWDGFNGKGTFCVDEIDPNRLWKYIEKDEFEDWKEPGTDYLLFGQTDPGRSTKYKSSHEWYKYVEANVSPIRFRKKENPEYGNLLSFRKKFKKDLQNVKAAIVLNSTVSTEILLAGVPVISMDEGCPSYAIDSHSFSEVCYPDRLPFLHYLAHCQWHYDEIENGSFWKQLYPMSGPRLCEWTPIKGQTT